MVVFDAYLRSKCTTPDIYTCNGADLVVIRSLRPALCLSKEEEEERRTIRVGGDFFYHLETSACFAKGIFILRTIVWSILDVWNLEKR